VWQEKGEGDEGRERLYEREPLKSAVWSKLAFVGLCAKARNGDLDTPRTAGLKVT
jgi:hypothetical protein